LHVNSASNDRTIKKAVENEFQPLYNQVKKSKDIARPMVNRKLKMVFSY